MRALFTHPEACASKLVSDHTAAVQFKNNKSVATLQKMLTEMCVPFATSNPTSQSAHVRTLAEDLVDPSNPTSSQRPNTSTPHSGLSDPSSTERDQRQPSVVHQPSQATVNTQLMDMILSLESQMQLLQQQAAARSNETDPPQRLTKEKV